MSGPPDNIPPSELWAKITATPRPSAEVDFPRKDKEGAPIGKLRMWVLTQSEQMICAAEAARVAKELLKDQRKDDPSLGYDNVYNNAASVEILARACRDANDVTRPAFPSPKLLRQNMTADEIAILTRLYLQVQSELGPIIAYMSAEEEEAWIRRLAEGGTAFPLSLLSSEAHEHLTLSLASRLFRSLTSTSSPGSPPEESSNESPQPSEFDGALDDSNTEAHEESE